MTRLERDILVDRMRKPCRVYTGNGMEMVKTDICNRRFTLYVDAEQDVQLCADYLRGYCYRHFCGGQMEHVLNWLVVVSYLRTPRDVLAAVQALRNLGVAGPVRCCAEYVDGYATFVKDYE